MGNYHSVALEDPVGYSNVDTAWTLFHTGITDRLTPGDMRNLDAALGGDITHSSTKLVQTRSSILPARLSENLVQQKLSKYLIEGKRLVDYFSTKGLDLHLYDLVQNVKSALKNPDVLLTHDGLAKFTSDITDLRSHEAVYITMEQEAEWERNATDEQQEARRHMHTYNLSSGDLNPYTLYQHNPPNRYISF